jgi:hypothetical protein
VFVFVFWTERNPHVSSCAALAQFSSVQVCQLLKKVARAGASVLFTVHQPSSRIFREFDHLILLHQGRIMYTGSVNKVADYFGSRGYPCPRNYNPADHIMVRVPSRVTGFKASMPYRTVLGDIILCVFVVTSSLTHTLPDLLLHLLVGLIARRKSLKSIL